MRLLVDILQKRGFDTVAVRSIPKASGFLLCNNKGKKYNGFNMCKFSDILSAFEYAISDDFFMVGRHVVQRTRGYPQGGSFSEPATLIDLGFSNHEFIKSKAKRNSMGMQYLDLEAEQILFGLVHVDDGLFGSYIFCQDCILDCIQKLWPDDVGVKLEESGESIHFLSALIKTDKMGVVQIFPYPTNLDFARGLCLYPEQSRVASYRGPPVHSSKILSMSIIPHFIMFDRIGNGLISRGMLAASSLVCEVLLLNGLQNWFQTLCAAFPRRKTLCFYILFDYL